MMNNAYTPSYCLISSSSLAPGKLVGYLCLALTLGANSAFGLPEDADQPIHIRADTVEYDQNGNRVVYRGSVQVDQGTLRVTAETMTIDLKDGNKVLRITAVDTPARYTQQIEADSMPVKAEALTIIYHTQDERVDLKGAANLEQEGSTLTGDLIVYDIVAGRVDATADSDAPVTMVLQPSAMQNDDPNDSINLNPQDHKAEDASTENTSPGPAAADKAEPSTDSNTDSNIGGEEP